AGNTKRSCLRPCQLSRSEQRSPLPRNTRRHGCCTALLGSQAKADLFQDPKLLVLAPDDLHDPLRVARRKRAPEAKRFQQPDDEPRCSKIRLLIAWFAVQLSTSRGVDISALAKAERKCARAHAGASKSQFRACSGQRFFPTGEPRSASRRCSATDPARTSISG